MSAQIYLDYQSTTPMDKRVLQEMIPYFCEKFGNPHSRTHSFGWEAEDAINTARKDVAEVIGADQSEIIFTSGATESNNLAIKGIARFCGKNPQKRHIITVTTEHKCVLEICKELQKEGFSITYLPVNSGGIIDLEVLEKAITDDTILVSVMAVNHEIGVIQPIKEIGEICHKRGVYFHTDCAQAFAKIPLDVTSMKINLMSISGHKIYGPKGVGALYVSKKPRIRLVPLFNGGGQERGMRSGTLPTPLVVGLGAASRYTGAEMEDAMLRIRSLADKMIKEFEAIPEVYLNGSRVSRFFGCLNFNFSCIEGESMIGALKNFALSSGSACTSASLESSHVLKAIGVETSLSHTSVRFGIGKFTSAEEIDKVIEAVKEAVPRLRNLSPLWDMKQRGVDLNSIPWQRCDVH